MLLARKSIAAIAAIVDYSGLLTHNIIHKKTLILEVPSAKYILLHFVVLNNKILQGQENEIMKLHTKLNAGAGGRRDVALPSWVHCRGECVVVDSRRPWWILMVVCRGRCVLGSAVVVSRLKYIKKCVSNY
jgi:hypothetical protein